MAAAASTEIMNVGTQLSAEYTEQKALNRKCLLAIMSNIRSLAMNLQAAIPVAKNCLVFFLNECI